MADMTIIRSDSHDAYHNLAFEEYISLHLPEENGYILFLWQNDNAVIIGRNQNAYNECDLEVMKKYNTKLVRRNTGGGAVYHDLGNLNFSVICPKQCYDIRRSAAIIQRAVQSFGIQTEYSGRNDLLADGKKFSGNAYWTNERIGLHHGTILLHTDLDRMEDVLRVPKEKLEPKGIASVRSRVVNLCELCSDITVAKMSERIVHEFVRTYETAGCSNLNIYEGQWAETLADREKLDALVEKYSSESWNLDENIEPGRAGKGYFRWGQCEIRFSAEHDTIQKIRISTDSLFPWDIGNIEKWLRGVSIKRLKEEDAVREACRQTGADIRVLSDIFGLINRN